MTALTACADGVVISIRVVPRASRTELAGRVGDAIKVRLQAPPVDGKANKALLKFLSRQLGVPVRCVDILSGQNARQKRVLVQGVTPDDIRSALM